MRSGDACLDIDDICGKAARDVRRHTITCVRTATRMKIQLCTHAHTLTLTYIRTNVHKHTHTHAHTSV